MNEDFMTSSCNKPVPYARLRPGPTLTIAVQSAGFGLGVAASLLFSAYHAHLTTPAAINAQWV